MNTLEKVEPPHVDEIFGRDKRAPELAPAAASAAPAPSTPAPARKLQESGELDNKAARRSLPFRSAADLDPSTAMNVPWLVRGYVYQGGVTLLVGQAKTAGKSTLAGYLTACLLHSEPFLDRETTRTPVLWLTEESAPSFARTLKRFGLYSQADLRYLQHSAVADKPWSEIVAGTIVEAKAIGAKLIIVDTFAQFAGLHGDAENNAGDVLKAIGPLRTAAQEHGIAVFVLHHERKSGGDIAQAGRGSSALNGAVDIILKLWKDERRRDTLRELKAIGRFDEDTPPVLIIELREHEDASDGQPERYYAVVGDGESTAVLEASDWLRAFLPHAEHAAKSMKDLERESGLDRAALRRAIDADKHTRAIGIEQVGNKGRTGYRYFMPSTKLSGHLENVN